MTRNGKFIFVSNIANGGVDGVFEIETKTNTVTDSFDTPFTVPHNITATPNGKKLYVTHSGATSAKVSVFSRRNQNQPFMSVTSVTAGTNPFGLFYVP